VFAGDGYHSQGTTYQLHAGRRDEFTQLMREISALDHPLRGVAHLWSLDLLGADVASALSGERAEESWAGALHLVQALAECGSTSTPRLWLVTAGVQAAGPDDAVISVAQSPLWGLGS